MFPVRFSLIKGRKRTTKDRQVQIGKPPPVYWRLILIRSCPILLAQRHLCLLAFAISSSAAFEPIQCNVISWYLASSPESYTLPGLRVHTSKHVFLLRLSHPCTPPFLAWPRPFLARSSPVPRPFLARSSPGPRPVLARPRPALTRPRPPSFQAI